MSPGGFDGLTRQDARFSILLGAVLAGIIIVEATVNVRGVFIVARVIRGILIDGPY